jgi:hypothetical protein
MDDTTNDIRQVLQEFVQELRDLREQRPATGGDPALQTLGFGSSVAEQGGTLRMVSVLVELLSEVRDINQKLDDIREALAQE